MRTIKSSLIGLSLILLFTESLSGQTNTYPNSGNVGIGTAAPNEQLEVAGGGRVFIGNGAGATRKGLLIDGVSGGSYVRLHPFNYGTSSSLDLVISPNGGGNVGIGTAAPTQKLTVSGNINKWSSWVLGDSVWGANTMEVHIDSWDGLSNGSYGGIVGGHGYYYGGLQSGGGGGGEASSGQLYVAGVSMLMGNVGIGTVTPSQKLEVVGNANVTGNVTTRGGGSDYIGFGEALVSSLPANDLDLSRPNLSSSVGIYRINHHTGLSLSAHSYYGGIRFYNQGHTDTGNRNPYDPTIGSVLAMCITDGNVGIGTTNPTQKLSVNGTVRAKEVIVDTGWSDYVFADDYRLAPLSEVERQIKAKKHLPGIPSAVEVAKHGVSVGDMQSKLLAKIEELTLYVIELKKENAALRSDMSAIKNSLK